MRYLVQDNMLQIPIVLELLFFFFEVEGFVFSGSNIYKDRRYTSLLNLLPYITTSNLPKNFHL